MVIEIILAGDDETTCGSLGASATGAMADALTQVKNTRGASKPRIAIIYARPPRFSEGQSLERQIIECSSYAEQSRITLFRTVADKGDMGLRGGPGMVAVASALALGLADVVLIAQASR